MDRTIIDTTPKLELLFKPFTFEEVAAMTGAQKRNIDHWVSLIGTRTGCGVVGLEYCQVFAIFVGQKYLDEGADMDRATIVVRFLADVKPQTLEQQIAKGNTFPVPQALATPGCAPQKGKFIPCPDKPLAKRLDLKMLYDEFKHNVSKVFHQS